MNSLSLHDSAHTSGYEDIRASDDWVPLAKRDKLTIWRIIGICSSMLGYQTVYSVIFALAMPMMKKLDIPQFWRSFILMAGPVCGLTVQPLVGFYSDGSHFKLGRRRPFIIIGTIGVLIGFFLLYYCRELGLLISEVRAQTWGIIFFIIAIVASFFFINFMQGPARTIVGDVVPKHQQVLANSVGSIMVGIAQVINNFVGGLNISRVLGFKENYQLVIIFGSILIVISVTITCITAVEEPFRDNLDRQNPFVEIVRAFKQMPKPVMRICWVLFFSWMGYFMFNVEVTDYCGTDLYENQGLRYEDGECFGMIVMGVSSLLVMIFGPFQDAVIKKFGLRASYAFSQILEAVCLIPIFFVRNKWVALVLLAPLGISCAIFNSVPYAIVGTYASDDEMGTYMGILNIFVVAGQQIVNWLLGSGLGSIVKKWKGPQIASGSVFAIIAAIMCAWIIVPEDDKEKLQQQTEKEKQIF
jgi:solute carrier family 45 protein 1/2/4